MYLFRFISARFYELRLRARRARTAMAFFLGRFGEDQAYDLLFAAEERLGVWPLVTIDSEGVLERVLDTYQDHPALMDLAHDAASRVASKWSDDGEARSGAIDWAEDLVRDYAAARGVILVPLDKEAT